MSNKHFNQAIEVISRLWQHCDSADLSKKHLLKTDLYNETWLNRLCLDWLVRNRTLFDIDLPEDCYWLCEAQLPNHFVTKGAVKGDGRTHSDALIGHFTLEPQTKSGIVVSTNATCLVAIEAKLNSSFSIRTTNTASYNQAARTVCAIAEAASKSNIALSNMNTLAFIVFGRDKNRQSIENILNTIPIGTIERAISYNKNDSWIDDWLSPTLTMCSCKFISWEELIAYVCQRDAHYGQMLMAYYDQC